MSFSMANLIEKLNERDKDERYMAMHDLAADLDRDIIKLENEMERRVVNTILKHLEDSSTDVKQQAVRTIASLAKKVHEAQLEDIADRLATHIINKTDEEKLPMLRKEKAAVAREGKLVPRSSEEEAA